MTEIFAGELVVQLSILLIEIYDRTAVNCVYVAAMVESLADTHSRDDAGQPSG